MPEEFQPITSQDELDRVIGPRLERERAKFADYDDLKAQIASLETEKAEAIALVTEANAKFDDIARAEAHRELIDRIAAEHGVPSSLLRGDSEEDLVSHATELKKAITPISPPIPDQESMPDERPVDEKREFARRLFGSADDD